MKLEKLLSCLALIVPTIANTEKVIFVAPESIHIPDLHPNLDSLGLSTISPSARSLRTTVARKFLDVDGNKGLQSWYTLNDLEPGQRYELRVCWPATVRFLWCLSAFLTLTSGRNLLTSHFTLGQ